AVERGSAVPRWRAQGVRRERGAVERAHRARVGQDLHLPGLPAADPTPDRARGRLARGPPLRRRLGPGGPPPLAQLLLARPRPPRPHGLSASAQARHRAPRAASDPAATSSVRPRSNEQCQTPPLRCGHEVEHCEIEHCGVRVVQINDEHREPSEPQVPPGTVPMAEMPERDVAELATELTGLAGRIAAQTCQFLVLLGEFDAREGWGQYAGILSCAHWLSWQCGMSNSTAREHVRVARALRDLPLTQSEF